ncbi:MAG: hypothetical protein LC798_12970 [Chloroflexi bacterium]|nr:hypothetical protein [Chloroflexota bacterium]
MNDLRRALRSDRPAVYYRWKLDRGVVRWWRATLGVIWVVTLGGLLDALGLIP